MVGNLLHTAYNLVDTIWVGRLGPEAVAALSLGFPVIFFLLSLGIGFTIAATALVAQHTGAGNPERASQVAGQTVTFVFLVAVVFAAAGYLLTEPILALLGAEPEVLPLAADYLRVIFVGVPFMFFAFLFQAILKGWGDTFTPMLIMAGSTVLNIILDPFLIFGWGFFPRLEVAGAAWATVISRGLGAAVAVWILFGGQAGFRITLQNLAPDLSVIRRIVRIGLPAAAEQSMTSLGIAFMTGTVAVFGTMTLAAYGIVNRVFSLVVMPSMGLAGACTTLVGQNLGAGRPDRAEHTTWLTTGLAGGILLVAGAVVYLVPGPIVAIFNDHPEVLEHGTAYLTILALSFPFAGGRFIVNGAFRGAGRTVPAMINSFLSLWILRLPLANFLAHVVGWGTEGLWWGMTLANVGGFLAAAFWFRLGTWKTAVIDEQAQDPEGQEEGPLRTQAADARVD